MKGAVYYFKEKPRQRVSDDYKNKNLVTVRERGFDYWFSSILSPNKQHEYKFYGAKLKHTWTGA